MPSPLIRALVSSVLLMAAGVSVLGGCHDLTAGPGLPAGTPNPAFYNNKAGAIGMYNAALLAFEQMIPTHFIETGLLTDELSEFPVGDTAKFHSSGLSTGDPLDERFLPQGGDGGADDYGKLQGAREFANQAIGALAQYDTNNYYDSASVNADSSKVMRGTLYALEGYAEIMLADFFCSGVPLSTLDYHQDFTYHPGSRTTEIYHDAVFKPRHRDGHRRHPE